MNPRPPPPARPIEGRASLGLSTSRASLDDDDDVRVDDERGDDDVRERGCGVGEIPRGRRAGARADASGDRECVTDATTTRERGGRPRGGGVDGARGDAGGAMRDAMGGGGGRGWIRRVSIG